MRRSDEGVQEQPRPHRPGEQGAAEPRRDPRRPARLRVLRGGACQRRQGAQGVRQEVQGVLEIKGGISDGQAVTAAEVDAIAELPSKDQLLGQIAGLINGFARDIAVCVNGVSSGLARTVQQISEQKAA